MNQNLQQRHFKRRKQVLQSKLKGLHEESVALLQEVLHWRKVALAGFEVLTNASTDCAVIIPSAWSSNIKAQEWGPLWYAVRVGNLALGSFHLPPKVADPRWGPTFSAVQDMVTRWQRDAGDSLKWVLGRI